MKRKLIFKRVWGSFTSTIFVMFSFSVYHLVNEGQYFLLVVKSGNGAFKSNCCLLGTSLGLLWQTRSLIQTSGSITPRLHIKHFFLPTGWTIRSLLSGPESGGCEGSKKWARSHWIIPLFQLPWPGMPNFTARFSSLCVNQSFARGPRHPQSPSPPWSLTRSHGSILQLLPSKIPLNTTFKKKKIIFAHLGGAADQAEVPNVSPRVRISIKIDHVKSIRRDRLWPREEGASVSPRSPRRPF